MRKMSLLALAAALTLLALPGFAADAPTADTPAPEATVTLDQLFIDEVPVADATAPAPDAASGVEEPLFLAGGDCGGVTCGKGEYCCNASCAWCRPYGVSCIQIACN